MAEQHNIEALVREVLEGLESPEEEQHPKEGTEETQETPPVEGTAVQHLYLVTREELERLANAKPEPTVVEANATLTDRTVTPPERVAEQEKQEETEPAQPLYTKQKVRRSYILVPLVLLCMLAAGTLTYLFFLPLTASADITIVPTATTVHRVVTLPIITNGSAGVQGRLLQTVSFSASKTVAATGHGFDAAARATGEIVFYNTDITPVSIPAGITFTVNGIEIVTDDAVTIPAAKPPLDSQAVSYAHAIQSGSTGNIAASAIYTHCCSASVIATNVTSFAGGRDARDYNYVQSSDIQNATSSLLPPLTENVTATLTKELHIGEQLVPPLCTPRTETSHQPGEEATQVQVSVVQTCKSVAYNSTSLQSVATAILTKSPNLDHFKQIGTTELTITKAITDGRTAQITISISGAWVYSFSTQELTRFKQMIAGKQQQHAQALLQQEQGIQQVTVTLQRLDFKDVLPTDPGKITIKFFYIVS